MTTSSGRPVGDNQNSVTAGPRGPVLMEDYLLFEKMAQFNRERIPERVVHAKGAGAHGRFTVTGDIAKYTSAKLFSQIGKQTDVLARFSTVAGEKGSADTARDPRGFSIKFYTEEGNWDMTGNNTPIFFVRDPLKFSDFIHSQKRIPRRTCASQRSCGISGPSPPNRSTRSQFSSPTEALPMATAICTASPATPLA